jgi:uncharacterized protein (TIGR03437 family)
MKLRPLACALLLAAPLFAAAGSGTTAIDSAGNVWRAGDDIFILATANAFQKSAVSTVCATQQISPFDQPTAVYCHHAFLIKQDSAGNVLYATYLGGSSQDGATAIATDAQGNVYLTGYTYSADFPVTPGVAQAKYAGPGRVAVTSGGLGPFGPVTVAPGGDAFVAKFAPDGTLVFSTLLGGSGSDVPALIAADSSGSIYIAGVTNSVDFPLTAGAMSRQPQGFFFARLNATGTALTYSTYSAPSIQAFDVDDQGHAWLTGAGPYLTEIDTSAGKVTYSIAVPDLDTSIAGTGAAIAVSASGTVFLGVGPAGPLGAAFFLELSAGGGRILAKTPLAQSQVDSLRLDASGNAYLFGHGLGALPAASTALLAQPCAPAGGSFVIESDPSGSVVAATYFRQGDDRAVAIPSPGNVLLYRAASSSTVSMDLTFPATANFACPVNLGSGVTGPGLAPGEIFAIFGTGIGPAQGIVAAPDASGEFPTTLGGVLVSIGGKPVPLLYVQAGEIHAVAPFALPFPPVLQVQYQDQSAPPLDGAWTAVNPGIFTIGKQAAVINQDGTVNTPENPARLGSMVSIYATGTGYLESPVVDGQLTPIPPPYIVTQYTPQVTFASTPGTVLWSGSAPTLVAGVTQINVVLPASLPAGTTLSAVPVLLISEGAISAPAFISVKQ